MDTRPGSDLANGVVPCRVYGRITWRRIVSLSFSDHCEPPVEGAENLEPLLRSLKLDCKGKVEYIEIRPRTACALP